MSARACFIVAGVVGAAGVAIGAFGAHALPGRLAQTGLNDVEVARRTEVFET